jgi:hypothetical protein
MGQQITELQEFLKLVTFWLKISISENTILPMQFIMGNLAPKIPDMFC